MKSQKLLDALVAMSEVSLHFKVEVNPETAVAYFDVKDRGEWPHYVAAGAGQKLVNAIVKAVGNKEALTLEIGNEYSQVLYAKVNAGYLQEKLTPDMLRNMSNAIGRAAKLAGADEFSLSNKTMPEIGFKSGFAGSLIFRIWWD